MITSRMSRAEYDAIEALNISRLKEMKRSPLHYQHALTNRKETHALTLGTATHVAVLEPERYAQEFAVWGRRTDSGAMSPRRGKEWDGFCAEHAARTIITADEDETARTIAKAVRSHPLAAPYLETGDPEVTLEWNLPAALESRRARGRVDWLTTLDGKPCIVGLKTARDCRPFIFGSAAAKLEYAAQWAYYHDGYEAVTGTAPVMREIVVESAAPHAVAVYRIPLDIIEQGRENYFEMVKHLIECERLGDWPGPVTKEEELTLPTWYYGEQTDDLTDLGLVA